MSIDLDPQQTHKSLIDFDYYRARAARERSVVTRLILTRMVRGGKRAARRCLGRLGQWLVFAGPAPAGTPTPAGQN